MEKSTKILIMITGIILVCSILIIMYSAFSGGNNKQNNENISVEQTMEKPF